MGIDFFGTDWLIGWLTWWLSGWAEYYLLVKYSLGLYTKRVRILNGPQLFGLVNGVQISNGRPFWFGFQMVQTIWKPNYG